MRNQQMDVVANRSGRQEGAVVIPHDPADVGVEFIAIRVGQDRGPVFGREHQVN